MKGNPSSFTLTPIHLFIIFCFYPCFASCSIFIFDYYWFLFTFPLNLPALAVSPHHPLHPQKIASVSFIPVLSSWLFSLLPDFKSRVPSLRWTGWACRAAVSSVPWRCWGGQVPWSDWGCWGRLSVWVTSCPQFLPCSLSDTPTASTRAIRTEWASTRFKRQVLCAERRERICSVVS